MNLNQRSKLSLCQFLDLFERDDLVTLLEKYQLSTDEIEHQLPSLPALRDAIIPASESQLDGLVQELAKTRSSMRTNVSPRYRFDERWKDLLLCLKLDGYAYGSDIGRFVPIDPVIDGAASVEDDLTREIQQSGIPDADEIIRVMEKSSDAFRNGDFNGCLNNARVALETLARSIAEADILDYSGDFNSEKWGQVIANLLKSGFITKKQEAGVTGVFTFISPGSHIPIPIEQEEFARLGRNLSLSICCFLVKQFNSIKANS